MVYLYSYGGVSKAWKCSANLCRPHILSVMTNFSSTGRRRELGADLREIREYTGHTGSDMAAMLHWTPSTVSRAETGKRLTTEREVTLFAGMCGVAGERLQKLLDLAGEPDEFRLKVHPDQIPDELRTLIFLEATATALDVFELGFIPGITQTEAYARALFEDWGKFDQAGIDLRVQLRMSRRQVLTRIDPVQCRLFVHETALRSMVGSPKIMSEQMLQLLFVSSRPQCSIRVVPTASGGRGMTNGPFHIFHYAEDQPITYVQNDATCEFLEDQRVVKSYQEVLDRVATVALSEAESRGMIASLASEYEQQGAPSHEDRADGMAEE